VTHRATASFWRAYHELSENVRRLADRNFELLRNDPRHPSLQFKTVGELWSARVGSNYRVLALEDDQGLTWIWIGSHAEYDRLLSP
jgi:mRNA-degrading endonuclease RelE of RelBE toxin-antitoxin system